MGNVLPPLSRWAWLKGDVEHDDEGVKRDDIAKGAGSAESDDGHARKGVVGDAQDGANSYICLDNHY